MTAPTEAPGNSSTSNSGDQHMPSTDSLYSDTSLPSGQTPAQPTKGLLRLAAVWLVAVLLPILVVAGVVAGVGYVGFTSFLQVQASYTERLGWPTNRLDNDVRTACHDGIAWTCAVEKIERDTVDPATLIVTLKDADIDTDRLPVWTHDHSAAEILRAAPVGTQRVVVATEDEQILATADRQGQR